MPIPEIIAVHRQYCALCRKRLPCHRLQKLKGTLPAARPRRSPPRPRGKMKGILTPERLADLYPDHSLRAIARMYGCDHKTVLYWLRKYDSQNEWYYYRCRDRRPGRRPRVLRFAQFLPHQERFLTESAGTLARELNVSRRHIYRVRAQLRLYLSSFYYG